MNLIATSRYPWRWEKMVRVEAHLCHVPWAPRLSGQWNPCKAFKTPIPRPQSESHSGGRWGAREAIFKVQLGRGAWRHLFWPAQEGQGPVRPDQEPSTLPDPERGLPAPSSWPPICPQGLQTSQPCLGQTFSASTPPSTGRRAQDLGPASPEHRTSGSASRARGRAGEHTAPRCRWGVCRAGPPARSPGQACRDPRPCRGQAPRPERSLCDEESQFLERGAPAGSSRAISLDSTKSVHWLGGSGILTQKHRGRVSTLLSMS